MKKLLLLFILIPIISFCQTQIGDDIDGEASEDYSGRVSLNADGTILAIGATENDDGFTAAGHVRVFKNESGVWTQIGQDIDGEGTFDDFGYSVSLSADGSILAVGVRNGDDINGFSTGHVRVFKNESGVWTQIGENIYGEATADNFGFSVSLNTNGDIVAVSAPFNDSVSEDSGEVKIYKNISGIWTQIGQDIEGQIINGAFGESMSLSSNGDIIAIGSTLDNSVVIDDSGLVKIYKNELGIWTQIGDDILGEFIGDAFGFSLSLNLDGNIVAIGAPLHSGGGHVRVYKNELGIWTQIGDEIDGESGFDNSGIDVSLSSDGNIVLIGSSTNVSNGNDSGHVRIYKNESDVWTQIGSDIDGENPFDYSGRRISLSSDGSILAIGALNNDGNGDNSGHVRVYSIESELATLEVVDDITGNSNGINVRADQLNAINGVSGAIEGVNYTTALDNGTFVDENNPTAIEIQAIINIVNATLGLTNINNLEFQLFPNPAKNQFTIQLNNSNILENVNIYNNLGQLILTSKKSVVNTSILSAGLYVVELETSKGKGSKKLIIE